MATQILTRKQRGEKIAEAPQSIERINGSSYWVKSQSGNAGYSVTLFEGRWTCDCPDVRFRQEECKHIFAVKTMITKHVLTNRFKLDLWEAPR